MDCFSIGTSRSLTRADENESGNIEISLGYRRRGRVSSSLGSYKTDIPKIKPINVPNTIRRLDHKRTYTLDEVAAISLPRREVATKISHFQSYINIITHGTGLQN